MLPLLLALNVAFPHIDALFDKHVQAIHAPGAAMAIIDHGNVVWMKTAGVRDVATHAPVTPETRFRIASMTKSFTAMSILKLRDEGKLSLDDPVARYIPELAHLKYPTKDAPVITIRLLLTHSEGFPEDNPWGDRQLAQTDETLSAWMRAGIPFSTTPGTNYEYSNYGFAILGQIVQRVSGKPYKEYVRENILLPLGMTSTTYDVESVPNDRIALGYRWEDEQWKPEPILPHGSFGAMGGLWTTPGDLAKYVAFQLSAWPPRDDAESGPVRRASAREMQQAWRSIPATATRASVDGPLRLNDGAYGYGLRVASDCHFRRIVSHGGGLPGYGSLELWLPDYDIGIVAFANVTYASWMPLFNDVLDELVKSGIQPRQPVPAPALLKAKDDVSSLINHWDEELASRVVADNFFLDQSPERRSKYFHDLEARHGECKAANFNEVENALRGGWEMQCERGSIDVYITMAPTEPPKVQALYTRSVMPPSQAMQDAVKTLTNVLASGGDALAGFRDVIDATRRQYHDCAVGRWTSETSVRLDCTEGKIVASLALDPATEKVTKLTIAPAPGTVCVP